MTTELSPFYYNHLIKTDYPKTIPIIRMVEIDFADTERRIISFYLRPLLRDIKRKAKYRRRFRREMFRLVFGP